MCFRLCIDKSCESVPFPAPGSLDTAQLVYTWSCLNETCLRWDFLWAEYNNAFLYCITGTLLWCCKRHGMHFWHLKTVQTRIVDCHQMALLTFFQEGKIYKRGLMFKGSLVRMLADSLIFQQFGQSFSSVRCLLRTLTKNILSIHPRFSNAIGLLGFGMQPLESLGNSYSMVFL